MSANRSDPLFLQIPHLYVRTNSYYELGYITGRTFKNLINNTVSKLKRLDNELIPAYNTDDGRAIYNNALQICNKRFPQYVEELQGIALGADIPFYKLFLLHINIDPVEEHNERSDRGCTDILTFINEKQALLGHNEDGESACANNVYVLSAEIINPQNSNEFLEKFTTIVIPAALPGGSMSFNEHGLIHSMNTLVPLKINPNGTPTLFLMRALLAARTLDEFKDILIDRGSGCADGSSLNVIYVKDQKSAPVLVNIECAPNNDQIKESELSVYKVPMNDSYVHCNRYLRLQIPEQDRIQSSISRHKAASNYEHLKPYNSKTICEILSDKSGGEYPVFRDPNLSTKDKGYTLMTGVADTLRRTLSLFVGPSSKNKPSLEIPIKFKFDPQ